MSEVGSAVPVAVLTAAVLHAVWNGLAHRIPDKLVGFTLINLTYTACALVLVAVNPLPAAGSWPYLLASTAVQTISTVLLLRAYQLGDFGQMYPIARGSAPLLVALLSVTVLDRPLGGGELLGVLVICCGLIGLALAKGVPGRAQLPALGAAAGTGVMIAVYTVLDGSGVRHAGSVGGYVAWLFLLQGPVLVLVVRLRRGPGLLTGARPVLAVGVAGGVLSLTAYGLVVWAQSRGSLAAIAALRETSIVIAALIATVVFRERLGRLRMTAAATVLAGIVVLELARP
ncbi:DMT family transporter [Streptomyces rubellomurinus]|uniref:Membrane protein n=2 Tax=Streptomyces TaxID=1883 RepID=A0A0F2T9W2_STRR3|nr:DMT family transporter [Streptomyces rubellomurinus]KJS56744.1 membrane protein [Streptomyces rubellomurinus subsp. indigoferus]KJS56811.1 membrane protein [Streptomyces rubellomurinus subsp. indigoferus]KJS59236.1 membrane protein [Streptomyces rubellomurinus]